MGFTHVHRLVVHLCLQRSLTIAVDADPVPRPLDDLIVADAAAPRLEEPKPSTMRHPLPEIVEGVAVDDVVFVDVRHRDAVDRASRYLADTLARGVAGIDALRIHAAEAWAFNPTTRQRDVLREALQLHRRVPRIEDGSSHLLFTAALPR